MMISFEEFQKLDIRIGKIEKAEKVAGTDKLVKMLVDMGNEKRQILAGIAHRVDPRKLIGKQVPILVNLEPKILKGNPSNGMMLVAVGDNETITLITPEKEVSVGTKVR